MYQVGQLLECYNPISEDSCRVRGAIGEVVEIIGADLQILSALMLGASGEYRMFFPSLPEGFCPYCSQSHKPLHFLMWHKELRPIQNPDSEVDTIRTNELENSHGC